MNHSMNHSMNRGVIGWFDDRSRDGRSLPTDPPMSLSSPAGAV
jgi:hypothetical protein